MPSITSELNTILKEMWRLDEKRKNNGPLTDAESKYWEEHLPTMRSYYASNSRYWDGVEEDKEPTQSELESYYARIDKNGTYH